MSVLYLRPGGHYTIEPPEYVDPDLKALQNRDAKESGLRKGFTLDEYKEWKRELDKER